MSGPPADQGGDDAEDGTAMRFITVEAGAPGDVNEPYMGMAVHDDGTYHKHEWGHESVDMYGGYDGVGVAEEQDTRADVQAASEYESGDVHDAEYSDADYEPHGGAQLYYAHEPDEVHRDDRQADALQLGAQSVLLLHI